ncbi:hypothetical protein D3Z36_10320 [Lachnospiraceae bacterium]|nr:hypothetical protein [Lachnospiraceae bacterium]
MNQYKNHTCAICGKTYYACSSCENIRSFQPWRTITDTRACYKIFLILNGCNKGYIHNADAQKQLKNCDLSQLHTFVPHIREAIQKIFEKEETDYDKKDSRLF